MVSKMRVNIMKGKRKSPRGREEIWNRKVMERTKNHGYERMLGIKVGSILLGEIFVDQ